MLVGPGPRNEPRGTLLLAGLAMAVLGLADRHDRHRSGARRAAVHVRHPESLRRPRVHSGRDGPVRRRRDPAHHRRPAAPGRRRPNRPHCCPRARNGAAHGAPSPAAPASASSSGLFPASAPSSRPSSPTCSRSASPRRPRNSAKAPSKAWPRPETANNAYANAAHDPAADAGHPELADHCGAHGRLHHQRPDAGAVPVPGTPDLVWAVIASFFVGNILLLILNLPLVGLWARLLRLPYQYVCVGTLLFCVLGAYSLQQNVFDVWRHDRLRHHRLRHAQDRLSDRAAGARPDPRTLSSRNRCARRWRCRAATSRSSSPGPCV